MDPHMMYHMPPSLMPTIPNILSSAYASRLDWIRNRGVREVPPTPPPVVTPSGVSGPGATVGRGPGSPGWTEPSRAGLPEWIRKGISPPTALRGAPDVVSGELGPGHKLTGVLFGPGKGKTKAVPEDWNKLGEELAKMRAEEARKKTTISVPELWEADPAVKREWTESLRGLGIDELGPFDRDLKLKELRALLAEYEKLMAEGGYSREGWSDLQARIEALRDFLNRPQGTPAPAPAGAPVVGGKTIVPTPELDEIIRRLREKIANPPGRTAQDKAWAKADAEKQLAGYEAERDRVQKAGPVRIWTNGQSIHNAREQGLQNAWDAGFDAMKEKSGGMTLKDWLAAAAEADALLAQPGLSDEEKAFYQGVKDYAESMTPRL